MKNECISNAFEHRKKLHRHLNVIRFSSSTSFVSEFESLVHHILIDMDQNISCLSLFEKLNFLRAW